MNCHTAQEKLTRATDQASSESSDDALAVHLASCESCRQFAENLAAISPLIKEEIAAVPVPAADEEWQQLHRRLSQTRKPTKAARIVWLTAPLAAAAALIFAFIPSRTTTEESALTVAQTSQVDYVEIANPEATAMVYVDRESGWLVVWADDSNGHNG